MIDPSLEIQTDVNRRLLAANITGIGNKVYSMIPTGAVLPWLYIGDDTIMGDDNAGAFFDCEVVVQVSAASRKQLKEIQSAVVSTLTVNLTLPSFGCHEARYVHSIPATEKNTNEIIYHSMIAFNYVLQAK